MVNRSKVLHNVKKLVVRQNILRAFTAICCATITGMTSIILYLASVWEERQVEARNLMVEHSIQLSEIQKSEIRIEDKLDSYDQRITENHDDAHLALGGVQDLRVQVARMEHTK